MVGCSRGWRRSCLGVGEGQGAEAPSPASDAVPSGRSTERYRLRNSGNRTPPPATAEQRTPKAQHTTSVATLSHPPLPLLPRFIDRANCIIIIIIIFFFCHLLFSLSLYIYIYIYLPLSLSRLKRIRLVCGRRTRETREIEPHEIGLASEDEGRCSGRASMVVPAGWNGTLCSATRRGYCLVTAVRL